MYLLLKTTSNTSCIVIFSFIASVNATLKEDLEDTFPSRDTSPSEAVVLGVLGGWGVCEYVWMYVIVVECVDV